MFFYKKICNTRGITHETLTNHLSGGGIEDVTMCISPNTGKHDSVGGVMKDFQIASFIQHDGKVILVGFEFIPAKTSNDYPPILLTHLKKLGDEFPNATIKVKIENNLTMDANWIHQQICNDGIVNVRFINSNEFKIGVRVTRNPIAEVYRLLLQGKLYTSTNPISSCGVEAFNSHLKEFVSSGKGLDALTLLFI